ncbi:MAG: 3-isopropylmalate dehydratase small subunit 2 [Myxococcota bacterium]
MSGGEPIEACRGRGIVLRGDDIDTDRILPARYMREVSFAGLEEHVFADARRAPEGTPKGHPFDDPRFDGASILIVNRNFGCGSSREHAPQALMRWGIRALVGESFAEIFFGNCLALGIPAVTASHDDVVRLMDSVELAPEQEISIDVRTGTLRFRDGTILVAIPEGARCQLLDGSWDATRTLLAAVDEIRRSAESLPYLRDF